MCEEQGEEQAAWLKLGVAAQMGRQHAADARAMLESLASLLESVLPRETRLERRGLFRKTLRGVHLELPDGRYALEDADGRLKASWTHVVRGIALKTEELALDQWLQALDTALAARAGQDAAARAALARFLE